MREQWRLLKEELHFGSAFFHGCIDAKVPLHDTSALEVCFILDRAFSLCLGLQSRQIE